MPRQPNAVSNPDTKPIRTLQVEDNPIVGRGPNADPRDDLFKGSAERQVPFRMIEYYIERERAEKKLRIREERYRDLFENANDGIYTLDLLGRFTSVNQACQKITGYDRQELLGRVITDILTEPYDQHLKRALMDPQGQDTEAMVYELEFVTKDGRRKPVEVSARVIKEEGKPIGIEGIARDLTERRMLEQKLLQMQKLEALGIFAGGVAHNVNNTLTVILGHNNLMLEEIADDDNNRPHLESIKKAG